MNNNLARIQPAKAGLCLFLFSLFFGFCCLRVVGFVRVNLARCHLEPPRQILWSKCRFKCEIASYPLRCASWLDKVKTIFSFLAAVWFGHHLGSGHNAHSRALFSLTHWIKKKSTFEERYFHLVGRSTANWLPKKPGIFELISVSHLRSLHQFHTVLNMSNEKREIKRKKNTENRNVKFEDF